MKFSALSGLLLAWLIFLSLTVHSQVFLEDFEGEANGATSGTAIGGTWTTTLPTGGGGSFSRLFVGAGFGGIFRIDNTGTEGVWRSNVLNISALGEVALEVLIGGNVAQPTDYVRAYYVIDGGPEVMFAEVFGDPLGTVAFPGSSAVVSGNSLQIVIRGQDNSGGGGLMGFDDVRVTDISVLYSRTNTAWNALGTWSTAGFAGASCGCLPDATTKVIIGNNRTVTMPANGTAAGVEIQNTGTLQWTANNVTLTLALGGSLNVQSGGTLTRVATTGSRLLFDDYTFAIANAGTINIGLLEFNAASNSTITNSGTLTLATSPTGLDIDGTNGYIITNTGTFNMTGIILANGNVVINNSGTINQSGNFTTIDNGSDFNNLATGVWNWSLTPNTTYDTDLNTVLDCSVAGNTFNYNAAGAQRIIPATYQNLTLSVSGAKDANNASFAVRGNWLVSGTATFTEGTGTITLSGTGAQTITNPAVGGETFNNLIINNTFATSPQITLDDNVTVSSILTMTDGNVNLNGNTLRLTSSALTALGHSLVSTAGWLYGGTFTRAFAASTPITIGNIRGAFPMGTAASDWRPFFVGVNTNAGTVGNISVSHTNATTATTVAFAEGIVRRHDAFWSLSTTGITGGTWLVRAGGTGYGAIQDFSDIRMSTSTGVVGTHVIGSGGPTDWRANRSGLAFGGLTNNFHLASTDAVNSPLPIILSYFTASIEGQEVIIKWKTAQEKNNHFFTVQKTTDFEAFYDIAKIDGQGNSREEHFYSLSDDSPFLGKSYYRLKQTDFDGKFTFSDPVMINYEGPLYPILYTYPNPFNGKQLTIEIKGLKDVGVVPLQIFNLQGQKVMDIVAEERGPGIIKEEILFPNDLPQGIYIIKAGKTLQLTRKLFVSE